MAFMRSVFSFHITTLPNDAVIRAGTLPDYPAKECSPLPEQGGGNPCG